MKPFILAMITGTCLPVCLAENPSLRGMETPKADVLQIDDLLSTDLSVQRSALRAAQRQHSELVDALQRVVRDNLPDRSRETEVRAAVRLLGDMRALKAVPLLVDLLDFKYDEEDVRRKISGEAYAALGEIGLPAVDPVLERLYARPQSKLAPAEFAYTGIVIEMALGKDALAFVKHRIQEEKDAVKRERLTRLLDAVEIRVRGRMLLEAEAEKARNHPATYRAPKD